MSPESTNTSTASNRTAPGSGACGRVGGRCGRICRPAGRGEQQGGQQQVHDSHCADSFRFRRSVRRRGRRRRRLPAWRCWSDSSARTSSGQARTHQRRRPRSGRPPSCIAEPADADGGAGQPVDVLLVHDAVAVHVPGEGQRAGAVGVGQGAGDGEGVENVHPAVAVHVACQRRSGGGRVTGTDAAGPASSPAESRRAQWNGVGRPTRYTAATAAAAAAPAPTHRSEAAMPRKRARPGRLRLVRRAAFRTAASTRAGTRGTANSADRSSASRGGIESSGGGGVA